MPATVFDQHYTMAVPAPGDQHLQSWDYGDMNSFADVPDIDFSELMDFDAEAVAAAAAMTLPLLPNFTDALSTSVSAMSMATVPAPANADTWTPPSATTATLTAGAGSLRGPSNSASPPASVSASGSGSAHAPTEAVAVVAPPAVPATDASSGAARAPPKPAAAAAAAAAAATVAGAGGKKWASDDDWDLHRPTITQLYVNENKKLWQLVEHMSREHGFFATPKMYKTRFKRWGLWKNTKAADVAEVLRQAAAQPAEASTTTTTMTTTTTTTTVTTVSTRQEQQHNKQQQLVKAQQQQQPPSQQVFLVNGKHVDAQRVERYIRNRCRQYRMRPGDLSASLLQGTATSAVAAAVRPTGLGLSNRRWKAGGELGARGTSAALLSEESTYRTIHDYFEGSIQSRRWVFASETDCELSTPGGVEMGKLIAQFHERWKVAAPLLAKPGTRDGAEGVKLARICFAELPRMIDGRSLGAEDPNLITFILIVLFHIRKAGPQLRWVETQLARHLADLATVLPGARPHAAVWAMLREAVLAGTMTDHLSLQITRVLVDASSRLLGRLHVKTIELLICGVCNFETGPAAVAAQEVMFAEMLADLDALGSFDERHAGVRMNLAMFYNYHGMPERAGQVARALLDDPWMLNEAKRYRGMAFQFYREWAESCHTQGRLEEAEQGYRDAHAATIEEIEKGLGGRGHTIDALVRLEAVLRDMHKDAEADQVAAEREDWIRDDLKGVGEIEDAILPE